MKYIKFEIFLKNILFKFKKPKLKNSKSNFKAEEIYTFNQLIKFNDYLKNLEKDE